MGEINLSAFNSLRIKSPFHKTQSTVLFQQYYG